MRASHYPEKGKRYNLMDFVSSHSFPFYQIDQSILYTIN